MLALYAVNRCTVSFGYAAGSEEPRDGQGWLARASGSAGPAAVENPSPVTAKVDQARALPARSKAYRQLENGRWRSIEPECWFDYQSDRHCAKTVPRHRRPARRFDYQSDRHCAKTDR